MKSRSRNRSPLTADESEESLCGGRFIPCGTRARCLTLWRAFVGSAEGQADRFLRAFPGAPVSHHKQLEHTVAVHSEGESLRKVSSIFSASPLKKPFHGLSNLSTFPRAVDGHGDGAAALFRG
jgi:hypothetical protein